MTQGCPVKHDLTDPDLVQLGIPVQEFAELRKSGELWWNEQPVGTGGFTDGGFWVASKHEHILEISKNSEVFSTWENGAIIRFTDDMTREQIDANRALLINHDAPEHTRLRKLISKGFTPRAVQAIEESLATRATEIAAAAAAKGSGDFVEDVAVELPLQAIADLLGVPQEDRHKLFHWSNEMLAYDDPDFADADPAQSAMDIIGYSYAMADDRRQCPKDDIVTTLVQADIDGESLAPEEFAFFVILLAVAGNETTRNAITHGMKAFFDNPEQWEIWKRDRPATMADEIVRWATPVICFQRTALTDYEMGGVTIKKGQRVGLFYSSANFDEDVFEDPFSFNILRNPNPHLGFGGNGAHYCVGANLARMEINLIFNAIADHMPNITSAGDPTRLRSSWINGIKHLAVNYGTK